ncbi:MAG: hypothetical protein AAFQ66_03770, partial [Pseudomonadota bacterium]
GQQIRVLSGEHENFSRLVMVFPNQTEWNVAETSAGYEVKMGRENIDLDLTTIFDLIPRDRIKNVNYDAERSILTIDTDCECYLNPFELPNNILVLDVISGQPVEDTSLPLDADLLPVGSTYVRQVLPFRDNMFGSIDPDEQYAVVMSTNPDESLDNRDSTLPVYPEFQQSLLKEMSRASTQGLIDIDIQTQADELFSSPFDPSLIGNTNSSTVLDRAKEETNADVKDYCRLPAMLDFSRDDEVTVAELLAKQLAELSETVTQTSLLQSLSIAKRYLYLGFGAEARSQLSGLDDEAVQQLYAISYIIDGDLAPKNGPFAEKWNCPTDSALWALLTAGSLPGPTEVNSASVRQSFFSLPAHLKQAIAPTLLRKLHQARLDDLASSIRGSTLRSSLSNRPEVSMGVVDEGVSLADLPTVEDDLNLIIRKNTDQSPNAILRLLSLKNDNDESISDSLMTLAEAARLELRGSSLVSTLTAEIAEAYAIKNEFSAAFQTVNEIPDEGELVTETLDKITEILTRNANDETFLTFVFSKELIVDERLNGRRLFDIAQRLSRLGFDSYAEQAVQLSKSEGSLHGDELMAKLKLSLERPAEGQLALERHSELAGSQLSALLLSALGNHEHATEIFADIGERDKAGNLAWSESMDEQIIKYGLPSEQRFVNAVSSLSSEGLSEESPIPPSVITRESARGLIARSRELRDASVNLLTEKAE